MAVLERKRDGRGMDSEEPASFVLGNAATRGYLVALPVLAESTASW